MAGLLMILVTLLVVIFLLILLDGTLVIVIVHHLFVYYTVKLRKVAKGKVHSEIYCMMKLSVVINSLPYVHGTLNSIDAFLYQCKWSLMSVMLSFCH